MANHVITWRWKKKKRNENKRISLGGENNAPDWLTGWSFDGDDDNDDDNDDDDDDADDVIDDDNIIDDDVDNSPVTNIETPFSGLTGWKSEEAFVPSCYNLFDPERERKNTAESWWNEWGMGKVERWRRWRRRAWVTTSIDWFYNSNGVEKNQWLMKCDTLYYSSTMRK